MNTLISENRTHTFKSLFANSAVSVEIPIIQRDYAQGRPGEEDVRQQFINTLYDALTKEETGTPLDLDFVYGTVTETKFTPLDGQQRLTTLFLLHWYLANRDGQFNEFQALLQNGKNSKFTYRTRQSAKDFCDALVSYEVDLDAIEVGETQNTTPFADVLVDRPWFFLSWRRDPTIQAMLVMLDALHAKFKNSTGLFNKLVNEQSPAIGFHFLNLDTFKLSDELYIKMNSRGKQLTKFENFKAKLEQYIEVEIGDAPKYTLGTGDTQRQVSTRDYFSHKIDTDWTNLFWTYRDTETHLFDNELMRFIRTVGSIHIALENPPNARKGIDTLRSLGTKVSFHDFAKYHAIVPGFVESLIGILDLMSSESGTFEVYLPNNPYYAEETNFSQATRTRLDYEQHIQFYAFYSFLRLHKGSENMEELGNWIRIVKNLTTYTRYDGADDFRRSIASVKNLLSNSHQILPYLSGLDKPIEGFDRQQFIEERLKAVLMLKDESWKKRILEAELHEYFMGQIEFLLQFSGITEYYKAHRNCEWSTEEDSQFAQSFDGYFKKASAIFNGSGLVAFQDHIWERALLTKGDYTLPKNSNKSLLINTITERDISWKRLLRGRSTDETDVKKKRLYIKEVLDELDLNSIESSLQQIIDNYLENVEEDNWRTCLVRTKELIAYAGKRFLREDWSGWYVLKSIRFSTNYCEIFTADLFYSLNTDTDFDHQPFEEGGYDDYTGADSMPVLGFGPFKFQKSKYHLNVVYQQKKSFEFDFHRAGSKEVDPHLEQIAIGLGFTKSGNSLMKKLRDKSEVIQAINQLCASLRELSVKPTTI